jgi:hypothetical protein
MDDKVERWLNEWYCKCRNKFIDLGNFGGTQTFFFKNFYKNIFYILIFIE